MLYAKVSESFFPSYSLNHFFFIIMCFFFFKKTLNLIGNSHYFLLPFRNEIENLFRSLIRNSTLKNGRYQSPIKSHSIVLHLFFSVSVQILFRQTKTRQKNTKKKIREKCRKRKRE